MRMWIRYEAPIMVCVDLNEDGYVGQVVTVVLGNDHEDVHLARGDRGQFLVYDENMRHTHIVEATEARAITIAEHRKWPGRDDWEEGHDALRYPFL